MYFIDLQKAFDTVDRKPLQKVLAHFGVPDNMIEVIRKFHEGMLTCVRLGDGECSDWSGMEQDLRR